MRSAVLLVLLSGCSLIDALGGQDGPWKTFERVRLPGNRSTEVITVRGTLMAASGGPDVTFLEYGGGSNFEFGNQIAIPDNRLPTTMAMAALETTGSPHVVALSDQGLDVIAQNETTAFCQLTNQIRTLAIGDLDGDGLEDIAVLKFGGVTVFFGAGTAFPLGLNCDAVFEIDVPGTEGGGLVFANPEAGPRLFALAGNDLIQLLPTVADRRVLEIQMEVSDSNGGQHIAVGDVDGDGALDLVHTGRIAGSERLTVNSGAAETFSFGGGISSVGYAGKAPNALVAIRNGDADSIVISHAPGNGSESIVLFTRDRVGGGFDVTEVGGGFRVAPLELFATNLDGDEIDDLVYVEDGDIVLALTGG